MICAIGRVVACLTLLLPLPGTASETAARRAAPAERAEAGAGGANSVAADGPCDTAVTAPCQTPAATPVRPVEDFGLLLPKLPLLPSACRPQRQYRTYSPDKLQRQPCYYV